MAAGGGLFAYPQRAVRILDEARITGALQDLLYHVRAPERRGRPTVSTARGDRFDAFSIEPGGKGTERVRTLCVLLKDKSDSPRRGLIDENPPFGAAAVARRERAQELALPAFVGEAHPL